MNANLAKPRFIAPGIRRCMGSRHPELLVEGPAGTGKTYGLLSNAMIDGYLYPGLRTLFIRSTRKSMNESVLQLWEEEILGLGHPAVQAGGQRSNRSEYVFPEATRKVDGRTYTGASHFALVGMDSPERIMSSQYDRAIYFEATEGTLHQWELIKTRMRRFHTPYVQMMADCNPADEHFWLNTRAEEDYKVPADLIGQVPFPAEGMKRMERIRTFLQDNPKYFDPIKQEWTQAGIHYKLGMEQLGGANYMRLVSGLWVTAEGQVWENYRPATHVVQGRLAKKEGIWRLVPVTGVTDTGVQLKGDFRERAVAWFGISVDWGWHPDPGVMQLWAFDAHGRAFLVRERYQCKVSLDDWAQQAADWQADYDVRMIVCDPSEPGNIDALNSRIGERMGRTGVELATKAKNAIKAGVDQVRWGLDADETGEPRIRIMANSSELTCTHRSAAKRTTSVAQEILSYVYKKWVDGKPNKEQPDPTCEDHGADAMRYMMMAAWENQHDPMAVPEEFPVGSFGHKFNHEEVFEASLRSLQDEEHDFYG